MHRLTGQMIKRISNKSYCSPAASCNPDEFPTFVNDTDVLFNIDGNWNIILCVLCILLKG